MILSSVPRLNISTVLFRKYEKWKNRQNFEKKTTTETEEDWNVEDDDGRSYRSDVDKSIQIILLSLTMILKLMIRFNSIEIKRKKEKKVIWRKARKGKEKS